MKKLSEEFMNDLRRKLETSMNVFNSTENIDNIMNKIERQYNDLDCILKTKGWKYMKERYLSEYSNNKIFFYKSGFGYNCMCIETNVPGRYIVTFTFIHDLDFDNMCKDYKKYCIYNFCKNKYTYNVKATSFLNAIAIANNNNYKSFPKVHQFHIIPELNWSDGRCSKFLDYKDKQISDQPDYFINPYKKYIDIRQKLLDQGYKHSDIRYYMFDMDFGILVLRKDNKYKVVFSFVNREDYLYLDALSNKGDYKHISRYCLINNYLNNKYCYDCEQARNSLSAAYYAFNDHVNDFPGRFKGSKIYINLQHYTED